jgi:aspartate/methionine/tyrosine aminotransferase
MSAETLSRPLAQRVAGLAAAPDVTDNAPDIPDSVIQAAVDALQRGETHYTDRPGILPLRQWIADDLTQRFGLSLTAKDVTITCGATEARFVSVKLLAKAGTQIVTVDDRSLIAGAAHLAGAKVISEVSDPTKVSVLYLAPLSPGPFSHGGEKGNQNPSPARGEGFRVRDYLEQAAENGWWVIWDMTTNSGYSAKFHPAQNPDLVPKVVTIGSVSDVMPGWRVGWMAGSQMAEKLRSFKQSMTICSTNVSQWAALEMVKLVNQP